MFKVYAFAGGSRRGAHGGTLVDRYADMQEAIDKAYQIHNTRVLNGAKDGHVSIADTWGTRWQIWDDGMIVTF